MTTRLTALGPLARLHRHVAHHYPLWLYLVIAVAAVILCTFLWRQDKRRRDRKDVDAIAKIEAAEQRSKSTRRSR